MSKTVPDQFRALSLDKQKLTGLLGNRIRANTEGFLENVGLPQLIEPITAGRPEAPSPERAFAGLFLDAAADAYEYNHDLQLRTQMDKVAEALAAFARAVSSASDLKVTPENLFYARADLLGLLAYYRVTSEATSLSTAKSLAALLMKLIDTGVKGSGAFNEPLPLAQLGLLEPMVRLYRLSGDSKYLAFCVALAREGPSPEITADMPQRTLTSTLTALGGLSDLYEVTGEASYLRPATVAWKRLVASRISVTGAPLASGSDSLTEADTSAAWLQFTFKLLRITGSTEYGDQLERSVYNQILAGQDGRDGRICSQVPLNGSKQFSGQLTATEGRALLSEAKALALLPQLVWGRYDNGIAINLYTSGRAFFTLRKHGLVQIYSEAAFPQNGQLQLHVEPSVKAAQFPLRLRVPGWTNEFSVDVADLHLKGRAGEVVIIDRTWKSGDTVRVAIALPLLTHHGYHAATDEESGDLVLSRGAQVLALGKTLNPEIADLGAATIRPVFSGHFQISLYEDKLPQSFYGDQVYRAAGEVLGKAQELLLVPLADAVNYRVGLKKQLD